MKRGGGGGGGVREDMDKITCIHVFDIKIVYLLLGLIVVITLSKTNIRQQRLHRSVYCCTRKIH